MKGSALKPVPRPRHGQAKKTIGKLISTPPKVRFREPIGHQLPHSLQNFRWNVEKVERKLQEKIQEKTKIAGNFVYQQAYRLLECTRGEGIDFPSFKEQLRIKFGIILEDSELQLLFDKYDEDRNGTIDLHEFIRHVLPPDYKYGHQWFELSQIEADEKLARLKLESRNEFLSGTGATRDGINNTGETSNWTLESLMKQIQYKVVQKTPSGDDQYRRAFKMLRSGRDQGIRIKELRNNLKIKFGIFVSETQMGELFSQLDRDGSGEIDLKEFLQLVEPAAYPKNSYVPHGLWTERDSDEEDENFVVMDSARYNNLAERSDAAVHPTHSHTESSAAMSGGTHAQTRKERPKSANLAKSAMLQQRRKNEQAAMRPNSAHQVHRVLAEQPTEMPQRRRSTMSFAGLPHDDTASTDEGDGTHAKHVSFRYNVNDDDDAQSYASYNTYSRPRSAGSVRSSRASSTASDASSVRSAAYMQRPSTAQFLRLKCLESRLLNASAEEVAKIAMEFKKRASLHATPTPTTTKTDENGRARRYATDNDAPPRAWQASTKPLRQQRASPQTKVNPATSKIVDDNNKDNVLDNPRVVKVHSKQHDGRLYTKGGRVLRRNKIASTGCR